jgi:hypothetical protein
MANTPAKPALYSRVKSEAKRKFKIFPSAYASAWIVKEYKKRGGTYKGKKSGTTGVARWMKEKWKTQDGQACGSAKFKGVKKCRPTVKVSSKTPVTWQELRKRGEGKKAVREKRRVGMGKRAKSIKRS